MKYRKGANNHHADALSRLLTESPTVAHDEYDDIPPFHISEQNYLDLSSSSTKPDRSSIDIGEQLEELLEPKYGENDHVLLRQDSHHDEA